METDTNTRYSEAFIELIEWQLTVDPKKRPTVHQVISKVKQMLKDITIECKARRLSLHPDKSKIMHNGRGYWSKVTQA